MGHFFVLKLLTPAPLSPQSQGDREGIGEGGRENRRGGGGRKKRKERGGAEGGGMIAAAHKEAGQVGRGGEGSHETTARYLTLSRCNSHLIPHSMCTLFIHKLQPRQSACSVHRSDRLQSPHLIGAGGLRHCAFDGGIQPNNE